MCLQSSPGDSNVWSHLRTTSLEGSLRGSGLKVATDCYSVIPSFLQSCSQHPQLPPLFWPRARSLRGDSDSALPALLSSRFFQSIISQMLVSLQGSCSNAESVSVGLSGELGILLFLTQGSQMLFTWGPHVVLHPHSGFSWKSDPENACSPGNTLPHALQIILLPLTSALDLTTDQILYRSS